MTKRRWTILLAAVVLGGGLLWALVGREPVLEGRCKLTLRKADSHSQLMSLASQIILPLDGKPDRAQDLPDGFRRPTFYEIKGADGPVLMAVDYSRDLRLCIDTDGDGILSEERCLVPTVVTATRRMSQFYRFGPISLSSRTSGGRIDGRFHIRCNRADTPETLTAHPVFLRTGKLRLAGRTYRVALVDGDHDASYHSMLSLPLDRPWRVPACDVFAIDLNGDGTFEYSMSDRSEVMPLGRLAKVEDAYYAVDVASDGRSLALSRTEPQFGTLVVEPDDATMELRLWSDAADQHLPQGRQWQLPAARYKAVHAILKKTDASGDEWTFSSNLSSPFTYLGPCEFFTIEPGKTTSIRIGPPFVVRADVRKIDAVTVEIGPVLVGCAGEQYRADFRRNNRRPPEREFKIVDEKGTVLETGKFEYG
ncbi:MAG: hypothetical protein KBE65_16100 [Phycisphaerae bacterium]|nr:hypothetical protein [Phycisphaerae bacterium]